MSPSATRKNRNEETDRHQFVMIVTILPQECRMEKNYFLYLREQDFTHER